MKTHLTSKTHSIALFTLFLCSSLLISGCEQKEAKQIQWQLPLAAAEDPHGSQQPIHSIPEWAVARQGAAEIVWLEKNTTHRFTTKVTLGGGAHLKSWDIQLLGLASGLRVQNSTFINDENVDNAAALVELRHDGILVYRGWLYEQFPELFGMDNPEWKVWLKGITLRPVEKEDSNNTGSLSSAG